MYLAMNTTSSIVITGAGDCFVNGTLQGRGLPFLSESQGAEAVRSVIKLSTGVFGPRFNAVCVDAHGKNMAAVDSDGRVVCVMGGFAMCSYSNIKSGVKLVACGVAHWIFVSAEHRVYTIGCGVDGNLGHGDEMDCGAPKLVAALSEENVVSVWAKNVCAAVTREGHCYVWGANTTWALTGSMSRNSLLAPTQINRTALQDRQVKAIAFGMSHALAIVDSGVMFSWGRNRYGQLGHSEPGQIVLMPEQVSISGYPQNPVLKITCGNLSSFCITDDGALFFCGIRHTSVAVGPTRFTRIDLGGALATEICTSDFKTGVITDDGSLYTWGCGMDPRVVNTRLRRSRRLVHLRPPTTGMFRDALGLSRAPVRVQQASFEYQLVGREAHTFLTVEKKLAFLMGTCTCTSRSRRAKNRATCWVATLAVDVARLVLELYCVLQ